VYWVAKREALRRAGKRKAADKAHQQAVKCFNKMCVRGYFKDSYNASCLLWLFGLSWWKDISGVLTDKKGKMSPNRAGRFLRMLQSRESLFETNLEKVKSTKGKTWPEAERFFRDKYSRLKNLLREAIDRNECMWCSL